MKEKVWSGKYLKKGIGETWCLSVRLDNSNEIYNDHSSLLDLYNDSNVNKRIFGENFLRSERFPILIKFLSVSGKLSVQVHPDDKYALKYGDYGKNEVWYVVDCGADAFVVYGLKNVDSKCHLMQILQDNNIQDYLNIVKVKKGDIIPIVPGTIHAIVGDVLIYEIQQNSDLTFRLFDWNRHTLKSRPLHIKESFDVINLKNRNIKKIKDEYYSDLFNFKRFLINSKENFDGKENSCSIISVLNGKGNLIIEGKDFSLNKYDTVIVPCEVLNFEISGDIELILSWI